MRCENDTSRTLRDDDDASLKVDGMRGGYAHFCDAIDQGRRDRSRQIGKPTREGGRSQRGEDDRDIKFLETFWQRKIKLRCNTNQN